MYMACTMLLHAPSCDIKFWSEAVYTACFIRSRLVTKRCKMGRTPFDMIHGRKSNVKFLRVFGSKGFVNKSEKRYMKNSTLELRRVYWWDTVKAMPIECGFLKRK